MLFEDVKNIHMLVNLAGVGLLSKLDRSEAKTIQVMVSFGKIPAGPRLNNKKVKADFPLLPLVLGQISQILFGRTI